MAKDRYVFEKPDHIAHCPACRGVVLRDVKIDEERGKGSFTMRCPHCQRDVMIEIDKGLVGVKEQKPDAKQPG